MTNVIQFPKGKKFATTEKPAGMLDVLPERYGMVLIDGCVPATVLPAVCALMNTAGVQVRESAA